MNESVITFQGWLGGDVTLRQAGSTPVASFRVASTPRRYKRATDEWVDGPTQWYSVSAWRGLGEHCADSLRRGDPVVVHGRLTTSTYLNRDNVEVSSMEVEALFVGHDLTKGRSRFTRTPARPQESATTTPESGWQVPGAEPGTAPEFAA